MKTKGGREIATELDRVEGRQRETNLEIMMKLDPVAGRQRERKADKPENRIQEKGDKERQTWTS